MSKGAGEPSDADIRMRIREAVEILRQIGFGRRQQNDRSALTLLALLGLGANESWTMAGNPLVGITPMLEFFRKRYGRKYAPNSRETVRKQTVHQFLQASIVLENPDKPDRPTNSGKTVYQIEGDVLRLIRSFGTRRWSHNLAEYKKSHKSLQEEYSMRRTMNKIPLRMPDGTTLKLSPGGQNVLVRKICCDFGSRFVPGGTALLVGDTARKSGYHDRSGLQKLGITIKPHGKIPDVIIHDTKNDWLIVVEAVTSHGPIDPTRRQELQKLFAHSTVGIVYVTAFLNKEAMLKYFKHISWETDVWIADEPDHMIHFDGERFLGPYVSNRSDPSGS